LVTRRVTLIPFLEQTKLLTRYLIVRIRVSSLNKRFNLWLKISLHFWGYKYFLKIHNNICITITALFAHFVLNCHPA